MFGSQTNPLDQTSVLRNYWGPIQSYPVVFLNPTDRMWITFTTNGGGESRGFDIEIQDETYGKIQRYIADWLYGKYLQVLEIESGQIRM